MLKDMLASSDANLMAARMEAQASASQVAALQANLAGFTEIARASVRTMGLHFGINAEAAAAMSATEVLAEHNRLSTMFKAKFKAGGVAATSSGKPEADASAPTMSVRDTQIALSLPRAK